jgi:hypothetical protein
MVERHLFYSYIESNLIALVMLALSWRWKVAGRVSYVILFLAAGVYNFVTALARPSEYVSFARLAYGSLVQRFFLEHTTAIIAAIAIGQLLIAVLISMRNWPVTVGLLGAVLFLVGIAPLGTAAGFPASLIMAGGVIFLLPAKYSSTLWEELSLGGWHRARPHSAS